MRILIPSKRAEPLAPVTLMRWNLLVREVTRPRCVVAQTLGLQTWPHLGRLHVWLGFGLKEPVQRFQRGASREPSLRQTFCSTPRSRLPPSLWGLGIRETQACQGEHSWSSLENNFSLVQGLGEFLVSEQRCVSGWEKGKKQDAELASFDQGQPELWC